MQKISSLCKTKFSQITVFSIIELCLEMIHHVQQNPVSCSTSLEGSSDQAIKISILILNHMIQP